MPAEAMIQHPPYLDDEGGGTRCYLLHHLAATRGEAEKIVVDHLGFEWDWRAAESDVVWLAPVEGGGHSGEDYYEPVDADTPNAVLYWRWRW